MRDSFDIDSFPDNESIDSSDRSIIEEFKPAPVRLFYEEATPVDQQSAAAKMRANTLFAQENFRSQYVASNLFDDQPPEIQVAAPTIQKRKPANLFADDESDDDSFSVDVPDRANDLLRDASAPSAVEGASLASGKVEQQTLPARAAPKSLEPKIVDKPKPIIQAENAIFAAAKTENENSPKPPAGARLLVAKEALTSPLFVKAKNLFAEDDFDDDDDLFTSKVVDNKNSISSSEAKPVIRDLFADSELDSSPKLLHASGVRNIFDKLHSARRTANLFAEDDTVDDDDNEIFRTQREANGKGIGGPESETATTSGANEPQPELKKQADVLPPTNQNSQRETAPHRKLNAKMSSLFGDESNDDNDPLFVAEPRLSAPSNTEQKSQSKPNTLKQISLFGDEDDDPFSTPPILAANQSSTKSQLIDDTHKSKTASTPTNRANAANLIAATFKSTNLFADDDLESEDELFKAANRGLNATKVISNVKPENENIVSVTKMPSPEPNNIEEMPTTIASTEEAHKTNEPKDSVIENYSNLTALLGEDPPDETEDIFKSVESGKKESISFIPDSLEDEKSSLFENAESLGSDSNEYAADPEGNIPSANVEKSFNNYSSLQLFNEEPPDDDINKFNVEPTEQTGRRNLIGVFEDSSNNVIDKGTVEGDTIANTYQYMLFTEEPPPMDFDDKLPDESSSRHSDSSPKKSESIDSRASKNSRQSPSRTDKLSKTVTHETSMSSLDDFNAQIAATAPLDSVNKSRARIMTGRRPSTRSGRQQQYEKYSQSSENEEISAPAAPQPILEAATTIEGQSSRSTTSSVVPKFEKKRMFNLLGEQQRELQSKIASELKKRTAILFKDDDESPPADSDGPDKCEIIDKPSTEKNIADLPSIQAAKIEASTSTKSPSSDSLSPVQVPLPPSMKTNLVREATKSKSLFADDSSDEDFFEKHIAKTSLTRKTSTLSTLNTAKAATETLSPQRKDAPEKSLFTTAKTSSSSSKLFSSSEDDDDDLFLTKSKGKFNILATISLFS